ncbi:MAG: 50S ribosomal protein L20 [Candidatus Handelsmanbacteria bacterium]|nr:50S ribosomal protein L20 [Candidatus Handelsmanbacteria bacterium]
MPRVKHGVATKRRKKKLLKRASGFWGAKSRLYRTAQEAVNRAKVYAYRDRRNRKREMRSLWIMRINAAAHLHGLSYSRLINGLFKAGVEINRKLLADMAAQQPAAFAAIAEKAKAHL